MGSDLPRILGHPDRDQPDQPDQPDRRSPVHPLPRLAELDVYSHSSPQLPTASISADEPPTSTSHALSGADVAGSPASTALSALPGPLITPPPPVGAYTTQKTAWTAINHPPRNPSVNSSQGTPIDVNLSRGLPLHTTEPQPPISRSATPPPPVPVSPPCSGPLHHPRLSTPTSPDEVPQASIQKSSPSTHLVHQPPTTPPQNPSPASHVDQSPDYPPSAYHTPVSPAHPSQPPTPASGLAQSDSAGINDTHSFPNHVSSPSARERPASQGEQRGRRRSVRFVTQPDDVEMMPPPSSPPRQGQPHADRPAGVWPESSESAAPTGTAPSLSRTSRSDQLTAVGQRQQSVEAAHFTPPFPPKEYCSRCLRTETDHLEKILTQHKDREPTSIHNTTIEDYNSRFRDFISQIRGSRQRHDYMSEQCPECYRLIAPDSAEVVRIHLWNRTANSHTNGKRKSPPSYASSEADASSKSRKVTPDTPSPPLYESAPPAEHLPNEAYPVVPSNRPTIPFSLAENSFRPLIDDRAVAEDTALGRLLTTTAREIGLDQDWETITRQARIANGEGVDPKSGSRGNGGQPEGGTADGSSESDKPQSGDIT